MIPNPRRQRIPFLPIRSRLVGVLLPGRDGRSPVLIDPQPRLKGVRAAPGGGTTPGLPVPRLGGAQDFAAQSNQAVVVACEPAKPMALTSQPRAARNAARVRLQWLPQLNQEALSGLEIDRVEAFGERLEYPSQRSIRVVGATSRGP